MKLCVAELDTELFQAITPSQNTFVEAIRIHLYRHNAPAGSLSVRIADTNGRSIAVSDTVAISSIPSGNFYHGYIRFLIQCSLKKSEQYRVYLNSSGYSFSESAYIGWCNDFDLRKYPTAYTPSSALAAPLDLEVWAKSTRVR